MAVFIVDCPHCGAGEMAFHIFGVRPPGQAVFQNREDRTFAAGVCGRCDGPVIANLLFLRRGSTPYSQFVVTARTLTETTTTLENSGFAFVEAWPKPKIISVPGDLPPVVDRAFRQAEKNYLLPDCEEAAATMYRRALDVGIKEAFPDAKGSLDAKIKALVTDHKIPEAVGAWAHEVRLIGNDGAHDVDGVTKKDLDDARAFIDTVLRYIFTLPAQISSRKSATIPQEAAASANG